MATGATTYSDVPSVLNTYFSQDLLGYLFNNGSFEVFGKDETLPLNSTKTITFKRYDILAAADEMTDGVQPDFQVASYSTYNATVKWYGTGVKITDQCSLVIEDDIVQEHIGLIKESCKRKRELLTIAALYESDSQWSCDDSDADDVNFDFDGSTFSEVDIPITATILQTIYAHLMVDKIKPYTKMVMGSDRVGSSSLAPSYPLIAPTATAQFWLGLTGFQRVNEYSQNMYVFPNEIGEIEGFRIILSDNMSAASTAGGAGSNETVYPFIILGKDANNREPFAKIKLGGNGIETYTYPRGAAPDYWHQFDILTAKFAHAAVVTQDLGVGILYAPLT